MIELRKQGQIIVVGHRGAMGHAPENTMVSFETAVKLGADMIELDIHRSRDGDLIVMHDEDVARTTDGHGHVKDLATAEIKRLDAGSKFDRRFRGERVPMLGEVLDWAKNRIPLCIEIKGDPRPPEGIEAQVIQTIQANRMLDQTMLVSFHHSSLKRAKELQPQIATGIIVAAQLVDPVGATRAALADSIRPAWSYWTRELVDAVHAAGIEASTWTVNTEEELDYVVPLGVDSIASNYPDRVRAYLASEQ